MIREKRVVGVSDSFQSCPPGLQSDKLFDRMLLLISHIWFPSHQPPFSSLFGCVFSGIRESPVFTDVAGITSQFWMPELSVVNSSNFRNLNLLFYFAFFLKKKSQLEMCTSLYICARVLNHCLCIPLPQYFVWIRWGLVFLSEEF